MNEQEGVLMGLMEEDFDRLERKVKILESEFATLCTIIGLTPEGRWDIVQEGAHMALEALKAEA
jgi:hypothetical protein